VQGVRKEMSLGFTERIDLAIGGSERVVRVAEASREVLVREALCQKLAVGGVEGQGGDVRKLSVDGEDLVIAVARLPRGER
jgi:isoleucyl-tRNA synthetase